MILIAFVLAPNVQRVVRLVNNREPPDRRVALRQWFDTNLDPGTIIVTEENHKTFNPFWSGLTGRKWFDWWVSDNFLEYPLDEWRNERGMSYAVFTENELRDVQSASGGDAFLAQLLHLRDFNNTPGRGPKMSVYRLWRMDNETQICFGDAIRLAGFDELPVPDAENTLSFRFYWQTQHLPSANYSLFIHFTAVGSSTPLAQSDGAPASPERPTMTWDTINETLIGQPFSLRLPDDLATGHYSVLVGLYDYTTGARLPVSDCITPSQDTAYPLTEIER